VQEHRAQGLGFGVGEFVLGLVEAEESEVGEQVGVDVRGQYPGLVALEALERLRGSVIGILPLTSVYADWPWVGQAAIRYSFVRPPRMGLRRSRYSARLIGSGSPVSA
jgi:hypothetical protein